jgi:hypothetical protein
LIADGRKEECPRRDDRGARRIAEGVPESQRLEPSSSRALGNTINARTTFGDYKMIGTPEDTLLRYPATFRS